MAFYKICPRCGAHLDPGEPCDCEEAAAREREEVEELLAREDTGQLVLRWEQEGERRMA